MSGRAGRQAAPRRRDEPAELRLQGNLDQVSDDGTVSGWCWSPDTPLARRTVAVLIDGAEAVRATCQLDRADLRTAGFGDGAHGFQVQIPQALRRAGLAVAVTLRDVASQRPVGGTARVVWRGNAAPAEAVATPGVFVPQGHVDGVTEDGRVSGWCWYPERPEAAVRLSVLVDGAPVGTTLADQVRADLQQAGIGTGAHGFAFALPWWALADKGQVTVTVLDDASGLALGEPMTLRLGHMASAGVGAEDRVSEDRVSELERQIRLLASQVQELRATFGQMHDERPSQAMFASLGQMFQHLAGGGALEAPAPEAPQHRSLRETLLALQQRHAPFTLDVPDRPLATVALPAQADIAALHGSLSALRAAGVDRLAEIVLVDDASRLPHGSEAALLPSIVRNLRYLRLDEGADLAACLNALARDAHTDMLVIVAPGLMPEPGWLETLAETLGREQDLALVGSRIVGRDGLLRHAGLLSQGTALPTPIGPLCDARLPELSFMRPVEAVGALAFAVRRSALLEVGGFQPGFTTLGHATIDLCLRLRADGHGVATQPAAGVRCEDGFDITPHVPDLALPSEDSNRLRQRWFATAPPALRPVRFLGHALVIDTEIPHPDRDAGPASALAQMLLLRKLGYRVTFAAAGGPVADGGEARVLEAQGIAVARPPGRGSVADYLAHEGPGLDLVLVCHAMNAAMSFDRVRTLAPNARLIFSPAELRQPGEQGDAAPQALGAEALACVREADATIVTDDVAFGLLRDQVSPEKLKLLGGFRHGPTVDGEGGAERSAHALESCRRLCSQEAALGVYADILRGLGLPVLPRQAPAPRPPVTAPGAETARDR